MKGTREGEGRLIGRYEDNQGGGGEAKRKI